MVGLGHPNSLSNLSDLMTLWIQHPAASCGCIETVQATSSREHTLSSGMLKVELCLS